MINEFNVLITEQERVSMPFKESKTLGLKIIDIDKAVKLMLEQRKKMGLSNQIEIRAMRIDKHKELSKNLAFSKDPKTGIFYGISIGEFLDGNVRWRRIPLSETNPFDLDKLDDAKVWCILRMHPMIENSPLNIEDPTFRLVDPELDARAEIDLAKKVGEAILIAADIPEEELLSFARFLAIQIPLVPTPKQLRAVITNKAMTNAVEFLSHYNDPNRKIYEAIRSALAIGIISDNMEKGLSFEGLHLGFNEIEAIRFLEADTVVLQRINKEIRVSQGNDVVEEKEPLKRGRPPKITE